MKKECLYDKNNNHIGYTKTYVDGTIVYLNLYDAIHRIDGPAVIELSGSGCHNYIIHNSKYSARYHKWGPRNGRQYNKEVRELWYLNSINISAIEKFPLELFNAYCKWHYKKSESISSAS